MSNPFDRFDEAPAENPFDRFDNPPAEPTTNAVADATRRVYGETGGAGYDAAGGMARGLRKLGEVLLRAGTTEAGVAYGLPPAEAAQAGRDAAATVGDRTGLDASVEENRKLAAFARAQAGTDPARDDTLLAKVAGGVGSLPVAIASGPAAPVTIAAMMGEQGANDAREKLAARGITDPAEIRRAEDASFLLNAPVGLVSEALLGAPALLRSVRGMTAGTTTAARIARQAGAGAAREGAQEGIEQLAGNIIAKDAVGYDPERERTAGVGEAVLLGSLIGGPTGAAFQGAQEIDARRAHAEFARDLDTNKNVPESFKTLYLQQDQLLRGLRPAQMFPAGSQELPLPRGMERLETKRGVFHFNPGQIRADALARLSAEGRENEVLALGPVSKPEVEARARATGEPVVSITERTPDGTEVKTAVGTAGTAAAQIAALERSKTPGNTVAVEQTIVERMRAQQEQAAAVIRADQEREQAARVERQRVADAKKARIDQALALGRSYAENPGATLVDLKSVATNIDAALADDSLGLTLEQRQQAAALRKQIAPRLDQLQVVEDAAAAQRVAKMKEDAAAQERAQKEIRRIETEALRAIERTGRDPREGGRIVDITKVPDDEFEALQNGLDAEGLDMPAWEREMERRIRQQEADDGSPNFTLADVFTGANGAKKWIGRTFKIPTAAALREAGDPLAGDMEAIQESLPASWFSSKAGDLDGFAQSLRGYGFEFQTPADLLAALRSPEDYRPSADLGGADQQVEFAAAHRPVPTTAGITAEQLARELVPVALPEAAPFARRNAENRPAARQAVAAVGDITHPDLGLLRLSNRRRDHLVADAQGPDGYRVLAVLGDVLLNAREVGRPEPDNNTAREGVVVRRAVATVRDGADIMPVRITLHDTAEGLFVHSVALLRNEKRPASSKPASDMESSKGITPSVSKMMVADVLPGVKPEADGTSRAEFARGRSTDANDAPAPLSDAEIERQRAAIIQSLGPRVREFDIRVGKLADLLDDEGYHRAAAALRANRFGEADAATQGRMPPARRAEFLRLRAEQNFLLVATREARAGRMTGLVLHELAHHYWNALPEAAKAIYRREAEQATRTRTGPLYDSQGRSRTTILVSAEDLRRAGRGADLAADPDLPAKEYFAELVRIQNADYAADRVAAYSAPTALQRAGRKLMLELRRIWNAIRASLGSLPRDTDLATAGFREWLSGASQERIAGTAAAFATTQATMDLGGAPLGLDLPNTIRNLTPKWQDKTVRFESNLDKALFYAGTEGNTATRTEIIEHLGRETGLSAGQIAALARDLRRKLAPLARSTVAGGTLRVPAQMRTETRKFTGVDFATRASEYVDRNGTSPAKRAAAVADITRLLEAANDEQLDLFTYGLPDAGGGIVNASGKLRGPDNARRRDGDPAGAHARAAEALTQPKSEEALRAAFADGNRISSIIPELIAAPNQGWDVRGAKITSARDVMTLTQMLRTPYVETFKILLVNSWNQVVHAEVVSIGTLGKTLASPRMLAEVIARAPAAKEAYGVILSHNHPSGDPEPSAADKRVTQTFAKVVESIGHRFLDHVVTNGNRFYSFRETGFINVSSVRLTSRRPLKTGADASPQDQPKAMWETITRDDLRKINDLETAESILASARQVNPDALHVIYLNTLNGITSIERIPDALTLSPEKLNARIFTSLGREGAASVIIDLPDTIKGMDAIRLRSRLREFTNDAGFTLFDVFGKFDFEAQLRSSSRATGWLAENTPRADLLAEDGETTRPRLPRALAGAKPRFGYGKNNFELSFESDIDRALFITAQKTKSKSDAAFRTWLREVGLTAAQIAEAGPRVRAQIKEMARIAEGKTLEIPPLFEQGSSSAESEIDFDAPPSLPEPQAPKTARPAPATTVKTGAELEAEQDAAKAAEAARLSEAAKAIRHPAAQGEVEPGDAWAVVTKLTPEQLRAEIRAISQHINEGWLDLSEIEKANARARQDAAQAELDRREPTPAKAAPVETAPAGTPVPTIRKIDRKDALLAAWREGKRIRDEGQRTGNEEAWAEGQKQVTQAKTALDNEYPEWADEANPSRPTPAAAPATTAQSAAVAPAAPAGPAPARAAQNAEDDGRNLPPPAPPTPPENGPPREDAPAPDRGRAREVMGHTAVTPTWWAKNWEIARAALVGLRGAIPEIPVLTGLASKSDRFLRDHGLNFYDGLRAFHRTLASGNDSIQHTAGEQIASITDPLMNMGGRFDSASYTRLNARREQKRRLAAENRPMPAGAQAELDALELRLESHPYYLFNELVVWFDLYWRHRNLKDSKGNPIALPHGVNGTEIDNELDRISKAIVASPHGRVIDDAYQKHVALVKRIADDMKSRDLLAAEHLTNPVYFPHLTLQYTKGGQTTERELTPSRVRVGTDEDFRGYLIAPTGSTKPIETDYVRAMYYHLVQVGAHNRKADAKRDHLLPYEKMAEVKKRAAELSRQRGFTVSWEQAFNEEYAPLGYVKFSHTDRNPFNVLAVDQDRLAQRLGLILDDSDLQTQLATLGVKLLPGDLTETMVQAGKEIWILPARVAEALTGIDRRSQERDNAADIVAKAGTGLWKRWKLFAPHNHVRYEYGNIVADLEKMFSASPRTFRHLGEAARELREFYQGGPLSADLRAALKDGVINAITAQEMNQLTRLRSFEAFETIGQRVARRVRAGASAAISQPLFQAAWTSAAAVDRARGGDTPLWSGLADLSSVELSAFREGVTRYANYLANLEAIRNGAHPDYAGAYWRDIETLGDSRPGAGDKAHRQAAQISKSTFGDYGDISVTGQWLRDRLAPFYSWMEVNFKYHANLLRNNLDLVRGQGPGSAGQGAAALARYAVGKTGGFVLRLALPYAIMLAWNALSGVDDDELSAEDRRRAHLRLGHDDDGKPIIIYANTALADITKWLSGAKAAQAIADYATGKTDFATAVDSWAGELLPDLANNLAGTFGPAGKILYAATARKAVFPDVTDQRTIPAYDLRRHILAQITDEFTADLVERIVNKDYAGTKDLGDWMMQIVLQMRKRDPESWAFYEIKDKAADFKKAQSGKSRSGGSNDSDDAQLVSNYKKALYKGDAKQATRFYLRLLDLGYTSERFAESIRSQDPLSELPKENGLRRKFVESLDEAGQEQLRRAYRYYTRISTMRGSERGLFPSKESGERGLERYRANPRTDLLDRALDRREQMTPEDEERRVDAELRRSMAGAN